MPAICALQCSMILARSLPSKNHAKKIIGTLLDMQKPCQVGAVIRLILTPLTRTPPHVYHKENKKFQLDAINNIISELHYKVKLK